MLVVDALSQYPDDDLDRLARDKIEEVANLRLPRQVLIQEIAAALASLSYVARVLAPTRPPTYVFLKLLMESPGRRVRPGDFRSAVEKLTDEFTRQAASGEGLSREKNYPLYLRMLCAAWEDDGRVDRSEALLLAALRKELGIWTREHLLLEHHPLVRPIWDSERAYTEARNHLLATGLVLVHDGEYVLPDEVALQLRRAWEIDLGDAAYSRLLSQLTGAQLRHALEQAALPLSGSKEERAERIVRSLVPPAEILDSLHINDVKSLCRASSLPVSAAKADLINSLIEHFDADRDLAQETATDQGPKPEPEPEPRQTSKEDFARLLDTLTLDLLYDMLASRGLRRSGSKQDRIDRLVASPFSEKTLLGTLRRPELAELCRKLSIPISGVKGELVDRLLAWAREAGLTSVETAESTVAFKVTENIMQEEEGELGAHTPKLARIDPGSAPQPAGLEEIRRRFAELDTAEEVVLALLREARSLNEREVERAVRAGCITSRSRTGRWPT